MKYVSGVLARERETQPKGGCLSKSVTGEEKEVVTQLDREQRKEWKNEEWLEVKSEKKVRAD